MANSPEQQAQAMIENMKLKTGKTLPQWLDLIKPLGFEKHGQIVKHLKTEHGITHGFANLVAAKSLESASSPDSANDLVEKQYSGPKQALLPIYEELVAAIEKFGADVDVSPKKAYVSLRRKKQFAIIQPSTKTRIDVGINSKTLEETERLESSGSFNAMVSHRVRLTNVSDVDKQLVSWLKQAYQEA